MRIGLRSSLSAPVFARPQPDRVGLRKPKALMEEAAERTIPQLLRSMGRIAKVLVRQNARIARATPAMFNHDRYGR